MTKLLKYEIWKVHYGTYQELLDLGYEIQPPLGTPQGIPNQIVHRGLSFEHAQELVEHLGFGYSIHPEN